MKKNPYVDVLLGAVLYEIILHQQWVSFDLVDSATHEDQLSVQDER